MNAVNRLLALAAAALPTASIAELWPQLGPQADLWKVPSYLRRIDSLFEEADAMNRQYELLSRLQCTREEVIEALLQNRLTAHQAVDRFRELDAIRSESGLANGPKRGGSPSEIARRSVLIYVREALKAIPSSQRSAAFDQVIRELDGSSTDGGTPARLQ